MRTLILNPSHHVSKFKKPIYEQLEYWDSIHDILGKRDTAWNEEFKLNYLQTALIDGGDTLQRVGMYYTGLRLLEKNDFYVANFFDHNHEAQEATFAKLYCSWTWGLYRRHPEPLMWYSDEHRGSRDNTKPMISSEAFSQTKSSFKRLGLFILRHLVTRLWLFDAKTKKNGADISRHDAGTADYSFKFPTLTGPTIWAAYIRAMIQKNKIAYILYPLLLVLDIEILINAIIKQTKNKDDNDVGNHVLYSCWFAQTAPTPLIWIMNKYVNSRSHFVKRLYEYYDDGREPWMIAVMWEELINIYFKKE